DGLSKHFAALHGGNPLVEIDGALRDEGPRAKARTNVELAGEAAIAVEVEREQTRAAPVRGLDEESAGAVAEQHRDAAMTSRARPILVARPRVSRTFEDVPVAPRHEAGVSFGAYDEHAARRAAGDERVRELQGVNHCRALRPKIECGGAFTAELVRQQR